HLLDGDFELVLANAMHIRNIPGRKSDGNDATWIADLLAHGLIRSSFVPPASVQELRDLTRTRKQLVRELAQHTLRIQKTLETANVKLTSVLADIMGVSGRAILAALVAGETRPERLALLANDKVKASRAEITAALQGRVTAHHRFMLKLHLTQIETLEAAVREVEARLGDALAPFRAAVDHLITMPGVSETVARVIVAEIGFDMTRFPSAAHLVSWAGLCPRLHESAGKRLANRTRPSNPWLKTTLVQAARSARTAGGLIEAAVASFLNDPRDAEEVAGAIGRVGEHLFEREARARLVVAHDVELRHCVGGRLDPGRVHGLQRVDVGEDGVELLAHRLELRLGQRQPGQPRDVGDVLARDHASGSSRCAYCKDSRLRPTLAKPSVTMMSAPSRSTPTTSPSPKRACRTRAPTLIGHDSSSGS